jgi:hypothetical protein
MTNFEQCVLFLYVNVTAANDNVMQIRYEDFFANDNGGCSPS